MSDMNIIFGPVPSRRLGRSLGINHIPPKHCSYSCRYCQVGPTPQPEIVRHAFHPPEVICRAVADRLTLLRARGEAVDYLTCVPDGEPTLDIHLGELIDGLRPLGLPIAIISNASLIWRADVRAELAQADWVSLKVDSVDSAIWRGLNRPHPTLELAAILDGIRTFAASYQGTLVSETMLVAGVNDAAGGVEAVARYLARAGIQRAYLAIPLRPPSDPLLGCPDEAVVTRAWQILANHLQQVELLTACEGDAFPPLDDPGAQLLAITAVHPMRESAVRELLSRAGRDMSLASALVDNGELRRVQYAGEQFYVRRLKMG
jgi:wyosine [tRNA(Phe)-imidazoG37] synthetase (radical SAM superfamily)